MAKDVKQDWPQCSGVATGTLVHVLGATLGLSALLLSSAAAYSVVKYAGAAYLFYFRFKKLRERPTLEEETNHMPALPLRRVYAQGVLVKALDPKVAIFFFAFLPQFVNPARGHVSMQFFTLGMLFALLGFTTDSVWALTAGSAAGWLRRNRSFIRNERYVSGTVYLGLGMATAVNDRAQMNPNAVRIRIALTMVLLAGQTVQLCFVRGAYEAPSFLIWHGDRWNFAFRGGYQTF